MMLSEFCAALLLVVCAGYAITSIALPLLGELTIPTGLGFLISLAWIVDLTHSIKWNGHTV